MGSTTINNVSGNKTPSIIFDSFHSTVLSHWDAYLKHIDRPDAVQLDGGHLSLADATAVAR